MPLDLQDAQLLLERAEKHFAEFNSVIWPSGNDGLWSYQSQSLEDGQYLHSVALNKELLPRLKPIVGDIANNLRHALDQIASAMARAALSDAELANLNRPSLKFPFPRDDGSIRFQVSNQLKSLGKEYADEFAKVWDRHKIYEYYFRVIRVISNNSKHWQLEFVYPDMLAVGLVSGNNERKITTIPNGHFQEHDRFEWTDGPARGCRLVVGLRFNDIQPRPTTNPTPPSPDSVFRCSITYVRDMIDEFARAP